MRKKLIFIPYQDTDTFYSSAILTREYAMLYMLSNLGAEEIINIKKPRTFLDNKKYHINDINFPTGTIELKVKEKLEKSLTLQNLSFFKFSQITKKRAWWIQSYAEVISLLENLDLNYQEYMLYSNNPFAYKLIEYLKNKGVKVYFDAMDNFTIHPSLNQNEQITAFEGYKNILGYADCVSANSEQTCTFFKDEFKKDTILVKNGVFPENKSKGIKYLNQCSILNETKKKYDNSIAYIGKIGKRIDADLVDKISRECSSSLFVFIGPCLKGQINNNLQKLFKKRENVLHLNGIPSAYVLEMLEQFDVLAIPHAVGNAENGGDPLKLYQYLTTKKPIMTTKILGVDEFSDHIFISNDGDEWSQYINKNKFKVGKINLGNFTWENRFAPVEKIIEGWL